MTDVIASIKNMAKSETVDEFKEFLKELQHQPTPCYLKVEEEVLDYVEDFYTDCDHTHDCNNLQIIFQMGDRLISIPGHIYWSSQFQEIYLEDTSFVRKVTREVIEYVPEG